MWRWLCSNELGVCGAAERKRPSAVRTHACKPVLPCSSLVECVGCRGSQGRPSGTSVVQPAAAACNGQLRGPAESSWPQCAAVASAFTRPLPTAHRPHQQPPERWRWLVWCDREGTASALWLVVVSYVNFDVCMCQVYSVHRLSDMDAARLFMRLAPRQLEPRELFAADALAKSGGTFSMRQAYDASSSCAHVLKSVGSSCTYVCAGGLCDVLRYSALSKHPIMRFLDGHPQVGYCSSVYMNMERTLTHMQCLWCIAHDPGNLACDSHVARSPASRAGRRA